MEAHHLDDHNTEDAERRLLSRINDSMRINYQLITRTSAMKDPYDSEFALPRYFLLLAELDEIDTVQKISLASLENQQPEVAHILQLMNQKISLLTGSMYDSMVESLLPTPTRVNISESGLSFYARDRIPPGSHIHMTISHPKNDFHLAATARTVYAEDEDMEGFRTGAYFISLHPHDRAKLAECITQKTKEEAQLQVYELPETFKAE